MGKRAVLSVLLTAPLMAAADASVANVATPAIRSDLGASGAAAELVVGGYLIALAVLLITGARLGQTHGYRRLFLFGAGAFGLASLLCGVAPSASALVAGRVLQGAAAALMLPQTLTGIQLHFSGHERTRAIGLYAVALSTGAVLGQFLGGVLISADIAGSGWRPAFLVNVPICGALVAVGRRLLPADGRRAATPIDALGIVTASAAILLLVVPLTLGRDGGWPPWTWVALAAAVPALWLFGRTQRRAGAHPLVHTAVVSRAPTALGLIALLLANSTYYGLLFSLAQYFQQGLGRGAHASGLIVVPWVAAFGVAGQLTRRLPASLGPLVPAAGYGLLAAAFLAIAAAEPGDALLAVLLALGGLGLGTGFTALIAHVTDTVPRRYAPDISGVSTTILQIGGAVGVTAFGGLYLGLVAAPGPDAATHAFAVTSLALGATALCAAAAARLSTAARYSAPRSSESTSHRCPSGSANVPA